MVTIVLQTLVTIVCAVLASSGFWAWLQKKDDKKSLQSQMLIGLAHDRIVYLGMEYIERGWITKGDKTIEIPNLALFVGAIILDNVVFKRF